jgi:transcriptional regulator GlxA family with amidase domain
MFLETAFSFIAPGDNQSVKAHKLTGAALKNVAARKGIKGRDILQSIPLRSAIEGLNHERNGIAEPVLIQKWADLVRAYVSRLAQPAGEPDRLHLLWKRVAADLAKSWSLSELAREAGYSREHLRRLCKKQLGRSPMHHVIYLRMRRAAELLAATNKTIHAVAEEVGYQNPFVFSNAFTRWIGWRPSEYRRKKARSG